MIMLLWRPGLSAATIIFQWMELFDGCDIAPVWPSLRRDFRHLRGVLVLPFARAHLDARLLPCAFAQGATGGDGRRGSLKKASFSLAAGPPQRQHLDQMYLWSSPLRSWGVEGTFGRAPENYGPC